MNVINDDLPFEVCAGLFEPTVYLDLAGRFFEVLLAVDWLESMVDCEKLLTVQAVAVVAADETFFSSQFDIFVDAVGEACLLTLPFWVF